MKISFSLRRDPLVLSAVAVLAVKLVWFAFDRVPLFYMGDSKSYIYSARVHSVLLDRSSTYGWLIWGLALLPGNLTPLVLAQTLAGATTAWLLAFVLLRYMRVRPAVAIASAIAFANEPLQILHERMVMTECFAVLMLALYLTFALSYLARPRVVTLVALAATGVLLLSLRLVYIPVTLVMAVLVPALAWGSSNAWRPTARGTKRFAAHLALSLLFTFGIHQSYRIVIGYRAHLPPAYQYDDGFFLAASWSHLLEPDDATDPRARRVLEQMLTSGPHPLRNPKWRGYQIWGRDGLKDELIKAFDGDRYSASLAARQTSMRTLRRVPLSVVYSAVGVYKDYWSGFPRMYGQLLDDQGTARRPPQTFLVVLKDWFAFDASTSWSDPTPSKVYHLAGGPWYGLLNISPLINLLAIIWCRPEARGGAIAVALAGTAVLLLPCATNMDALHRYLHPVTLTAFVALAVVVDACYRISARRGGRARS
jgi:hypothetical protein